ncbi:MAG: hypothetical protein A4E39_01456 [Methanoregulaceae archaeon PtaB.Bin152]|nr:MAG: hypothetical protein A4E39_01456 [Methanoregulaceae archaeon PtaB.Bin152]
MYISHREGISRRDERRCRGQTHTRVPSMGWEDEKNVVTAIILSPPDEERPRSGVGGKRLRPILTTDP